MDGSWDGPPVQKTTLSLKMSALKTDGEEVMMAMMMVDGMQSRRASRDGGGNG